MKCPIFIFLFRYSQHIIWAHTAYSNNNPRIITQYFLETIETVGGQLCTIHMRICLKISCPPILRADRGTENSFVAFLQQTFRHKNVDAFVGEKSFQYGRSTANQVSKLYKQYV